MKKLLLFTVLNVMFCSYIFLQVRHAMSNYIQPWYTVYLDIQKA